jgi:hypothetical protein
MDMPQEKLQEYWDACLIKRWRRFGTLLDAILEWERLTGKRFSDVELLRAPNKNMPWKLGTRAFMAAYLPKINDRLCDQPPEKDLALLRKLQTVKYDTFKTQMPSRMMSEIAKEKRATDKSKAISMLDVTNYSNRNHDTDWNVTKGSRRHTR